MRQADNARINPWVRMWLFSAGSISARPTRSACRRCASWPTDLGYAEVRTYINSGNLIFSSTKTAATLEREISAAIKSTIGHSIDVAVRTPAQLKKVWRTIPIRTATRAR